MKTNVLQSETFISHSILFLVRVEIMATGTFFYLYENIQNEAYTEYQRKKLNDLYVPITGPNKNHPQAFVCTKWKFVYLNQKWSEM